MPEGRKRARRGRGGCEPVLVAALDLGTNNCRLLVARSTPRGELRVVDSFSRIVRLGEGVAQSGRLSEAAMARTIEALKVCAGRLSTNGVKRVRAVATEACRRAENAGELVSRARNETGIVLEIISSSEEARLAAIGCAPLLDAESEGGLIFDIGGGSTEIIWMKRSGRGQSRVLAATSQPLGVVTLAESWSGAPLDRTGFARMRDGLVDHLRPVKVEMESAAVFDPYTHHLLGTSGTVTTLAAIALGLARYERNRVDGSWHSCRDIAAVVDRLIDLDLKARGRIGCVGPDRADLIVPGCAIFTAILALWPCERLRVADRGLREGMLRELMGRR
ncbi:MAG TPA: Ppx/GppA phosphatase family protein [Rhizomicrobium sp.]|nr:Ppx/GppA phosphatase family protein [Rhizomicrobium sp.]